MNYPAVLPAEPSAPPAAATMNPPVVVCGLDSTKLTFGEWWRMSPGVSALIGWCAGLFRARILDSARLHIVRDAARMEIPLNAVTDAPRRKIMERVEALKQLGFGEPRLLRLVDVFTNRETILAIQIDSAGRTLSRVAYVYPLQGATAKKKRFSIGFLSAFQDATMLCTDDKRPALISAPTVFARWCRGSLPARLRDHEKNLHAINAAPVKITDTNAWRICDEYERALAEFQQSRGLYHTISDAEGANVAGKGSEDEIRDAATLAELTRLQTTKRSSMAGIIMLVVSVLVFAGTGAMAWSWKFCAGIAVTLFVHELGHYLAMRCFKYRELRMFFIPLLGAAVTGKHYNVAGWKKAMVSLMGPLPGIVIGAAMAVFAFVYGSQWMAGAAFLVIGLNLFNLVPVLPLDGGWFWNSVLFCRHRTLEVGFKGLAAFVLIGSSLIGGGRVWLYVGISLLAAIPKTWRLGDVVARLKERGWQSGNEDLISNETAQLILAELRTARKTPPPAKVAAAETLHVFERLNAHPPNWLESFGLSALYGATIVVAFVGLGFGAAAKEKLPGGKVVSMSDAPREHVPVLTARFQGELASSPESSTQVEPETASRRIVRTFPDSATAAVAFRKAVQARVGADKLVQFGQTVIAVTPRKNNKAAAAIAEQLRQPNGEVFDTGSVLDWMQLDFAFSAANPQIAQQLHAEIRSYLSLPTDMRPTPPWQADDAFTPEQRQQFARAGATYVRVQQLQQDAFDSPELRREMERVARPGLLNIFLRRKTVVTDWQKIRDQRERVWRTAVQHLQTSRDSTLDQRVIELALHEPRRGTSAAEAAANEAWRAQMRLLLTGSEEISENLERQINGQITVSGADVTLHSVGLSAPERTLPALANCLMRTRCTNLRYGFYKANVSDPRLVALDD
jgi:Zn-dependent protease